MINGYADPQDRLIARSVFGMDDADVVLGLIRDWMAEQRFGPARVSAVEFSVGAAVTIVLADGCRIFVKVWPGTADAPSLEAQVKLQSTMATRGYPAPAVLTRLSRLGPGWAVGMEYNRAGVPTDVRIPGVRRAMAFGLARFVAEATEVSRNLDGLSGRTVLPERVIWPKPHNALFDFEATSEGAEWIDEAARRSLSAMRSTTSRAVVGHHDWSAKNMRVGPDGVAVLYDWDAVFHDREAFIVGSAAAHFPVTWELDVPETPAIGEVTAFVRDYEQARGATFTCSELAGVEAGVTYARAYKARCEHAIDPGGGRWRGSSRESLKLNGSFRF